MHYTVYPLHPAQYEILIDQAIDPESPHYNIGVYLKIEGNINIDLFRTILLESLANFDAFKMRFDILDEMPVCYVAHNDNYASEILKEMDFSNSSNPEVVSLAWVTKQFGNTFKMSKEVKPYEVAIIKVRNEVYWFYCRHHHLITDGYGLVVWINNIISNYRSAKKGDTLITSHPSYINQLEKASTYRKSASYLAEAEYWTKKLQKQPKALLRKNTSYIPGINC